MCVNVRDCMCLCVENSMRCIVGLWLEAAELIWASLVGFHVLSRPDKKVNTVYSNDGNGYVSLYGHCFLLPLILPI